MANALQLIGGSVLKDLESHTKERKVIRITDIAKKESNMADKVQKIKEWISKTQDGLMNAQGNFEYPEHEGAYHILCSLDAYIDSLQEESVSEDLEEAADSYIKTHGEILGFGKQTFKAGAEWGKNRAMVEIQAQSIALAHGCPKESITEDLGDYINELSKRYPEISFAKLSRIAVRVAKWQKEQIKKAMDLGEPPYLISIEQAYYRTLKLLEE